MLVDGLGRDVLWEVLLQDAVESSPPDLRVVDVSVISDRCYVSQSMCFCIHSSDTLSPRGERLLGTRREGESRVEMRTHLSIEYSSIFVPNFRAAYPPSLSVPWASISANVCISVLNVGSRVHGV